MPGFWNQDVFEKQYLYLSPENGHYYNIISALWIESEFFLTSIWEFCRTFLTCLIMIKLKCYKKTWFYRIITLKLLQVHRNIIQYNIIVSILIFNYFFQLILLRFVFNL